MITIELPDSFDLRTSPELGALALLDAALVTAGLALHLEHAELHAVLQRADISRAPDVLVASLLAARFRELRQLLDLYVATTRRDRGHDDDLPF